MKAVFDIRHDHEFDEIRHCYRISTKRLYSNAKESDGDWIIYREPRQGGGSMCYFATARVTNIEPVPREGKFSYIIHVTNFQKFDTKVPLQREGRYYEARLEGLGPTQIGPTLQGGSSVRTISDEEFYAIIYDGLGPMVEAARIPPEASLEEKTRRFCQMLVNRPQREAQFRTDVVEAYGKTCAVTGLRIINGRGRAEVQAAHIRSVQDGGPDIVQNGIALSATCHWLFDRHLISLNDNYGLLVSPKLLVSSNRMPSEMRSLFENPPKRIRLPSDERLWPRRDFIERHREKFNKHSRNLN